MAKRIEPCLLLGDALYHSASADMAITAGSMRMPQTGSIGIITLPTALPMRRRARRVLLQVTLAGAMNFSPRRSNR